MGVEGSDHGINHSLAVKPGHILLGVNHNVRVEVGKEIGRGGTATVFETANKQVVKVFGPTRDEEPINYTNVEHEAEMQAAFKDSPDIVVPIHVYDIASDRERNPFILMDHGGKSLAFLIAVGKITPRQAFSYFEQSANILYQMHAAGMLHRDVKPHNFLKDEYDKVRVIDFGVAKRAGSIDLIPAGDVWGTPLYLSPERYHGNNDEPSSDQFALGVMGYEIFTNGGHPYVPDQTHGVDDCFEGIVHGKMTPLKKLVHGSMTVWHEQIEPILAIAAAKTSGQRFTDFDELMGELEIARVNAERGVAHPKKHIDLDLGKFITIFRGSHGNNRDEYPTIAVAHRE